MQLHGVSVTIPFLLCVTSALRKTTHTVPSNLDPLFQCENGQRTVVTRHNDGINDCGDNTDEDDDPLLFYTVLHPEEEWDPVMRGFFLRSDKTFRTATTTLPSCNYPSMLVAARGPYVYLMCPGQHSQIFQMTRNGSRVVTISRPGKEIQALVFDEVAGNAYLLENSRIKLCDNDLLLCSTLHGRLRHKPISLAFSSDRGFLFWIEKKEGMESFLVRSRRDGTEAEIILRNNTDPFESVVIDQNSNKLYLLTNITKSIYSSTFDGTIKELIISGLNNVYTFAVDRGHLFWADQVNNRAVTCDADSYSRPRCKPSHYQPHLSQTQIGQNIIIYTGKERFVKEKSPGKQACEGLSCSHLCSYASEAEYTCFCDTSNGKLSPNPNSGFCEGTTVIAASGNDFLVFGLHGNGSTQSYLPIIRQTSFKNIDSISAIAYDSVQGRIILTETGRENIYMWMPERSEPELIEEGGPGTITSLEFDDVGNNIYWISPSDGSLKVRSSLTNKTSVIISRNLSSFPFALTLAPSKGYMFVLFKTNTSSIQLEGLSMSGDTDTFKLWHHFKQTNITDLSIHYMRSRDVLLVMDRLNNNILYAEMKTPTARIKFDYLIDNDMGQFESMTSLDESVIWTEADGLLRSLDMRMHDHLVQRIQFGDFSTTRRTTKYGALKIAGVVAQQKSANGCIPENGGCEDLCLISNTSSFVCRCALDDSQSCKRTQKNHVERSVPSISKETAEVELMNSENDFESIAKVKSEQLHHQGSFDFDELVPLFALAIVAVTVAVIMFYKKIAMNNEKHSNFLEDGTSSQMNMISVAYEN